MKNSPFDIYKMSNIILQEGEVCFSNACYEWANEDKCLHMFTLSSFFNPFRHNIKNISDYNKQKKYN